MGLSDASMSPCSHFFVVIVVVGIEHKTSAHQASILPTDLYPKFSFSLKPFMSCLVSWVSFLLFAPVASHLLLASCIFFVINTKTREDYQALSTWAPRPSPTGSQVAAWSPGLLKPITHSLFITPFSWPFILNPLWAVPSVLAPRI